MVRVYLDQNHWIYLSRALNGKPRSQEEADAALSIQASVETAQASYSLSIAHLEETWRQRRADKRLPLADTMSLISKNHAIAPPWAVLPGELDRALRARFGQPHDPRPLQPFGTVMRHLSGGLAPEMSEDIVAALVTRHPQLDRQRIIDAIDGVMRSGPAFDLPFGGIAPPSRGPSEEFARTEQEVLDAFAEHGSDSDERRRAVAAKMFLDLRDELHEAQLRTTISTDAVIDLGADGLVDFMLDLPSRAALLELVTQQHRNPQTRWAANDRNDLVFTSLAVGYCDIVVAERRWTANLNHSNIPARMQTKVIRRLADLPAAALSVTS